MYQSPQQPYHLYNSHRQSRLEDSSTTNNYLQKSTLKYREKGSQQPSLPCSYSHSFKLKQKKSMNNSDDSVDTCESDGTHCDTSDFSFSKTKHQDQTRSKNKLKVQLCKNFLARGYCPYESRCRFAHGISELRAKEPHYSQLYRTRLCKVFFEKGQCRFGQRCNFRHKKQQDYCEKKSEERKTEIKILLRDSMPDIYYELIGQVRSTSRLIGMLFQQNSQDHQ